MDKKNKPASLFPGVSLEKLSLGDKSFADIGLPSNTVNRLDELSHQVLKASKADPARGRKGARALFTGSSGTGKTLAAKILAAELGMDIYRVDLAAITSKYIGETEKNLQQLLSRAEELDAVLLFDEADALFGKRTGIEDAHDRYANIETDSLLARLESYTGVVILTTNNQDNIDNAFVRRMDLVIDFDRSRVQPRYNRKK